MKTGFVKACTLLSIMTCGISAMSEASAARMEWYNTIYFDSNHNLVGQHLEFCNNVQWSGGQLSGHYRLEVFGGCGDPIMECEQISSGIVCTEIGHYWTQYAFLRGQYAGTTISEVCDTSYPVCVDLQVPTFVDNVTFPFYQVYP